MTNVLDVSKSAGISPTAAGAYVDALTDALLFHKAERYDTVGKRMLSSGKKHYAADVGMRNAVLGAGGMGDPSRPLENVVHLELLRRGYDVSVGSYRGRETGFTARKGDVIEYCKVPPR